MFFFSRRNLAGNKNIPRLSEALAPEVFEFYVRHQAEIDKNIQHFFADEGSRYDEYLEPGNIKDESLIGNPVSVHFSSFTYRPLTLADKQLAIIAEKYNKNRPVEVDEFLLEEKKMTAKKNVQKVAFKSNSMRHLLRDIKNSLQPTPAAEYQTDQQGVKAFRLLTEPTQETPLLASEIGTGSVSFRTTFHQNMLKAAKDYKITTNSANSTSQNKRSPDIPSTVQIPAQKAQTHSEHNKPLLTSERLLTNRKSHSFLNTTASNMTINAVYSRGERSVGNPNDTRGKYSRVESEQSKTLGVEDSFKIHAKYAAGETGGEKDKLPESRNDEIKLPRMRLLKTNASQESEANPPTTTTKTSSRPQLIGAGKSLSHLRAKINDYHGGTSGKLQPAFSPLSAGFSLAG